MTDEIGFRLKVLSDWFAELSTPFRHFSQKKRGLACHNTAMQDDQKNKPPKRNQFQKNRNLLCHMGGKNFHRSWFPPYKIGTIP